MSTSRTVVLVLRGWLAAAAISISACKSGDGAPKFVLADEQTGIDIVVGQSVVENCHYSMAGVSGDTTGFYFFWMIPHFVTVTSLAPPSECSVTIRGDSPGTEQVSFFTKSRDGNTLNVHLLTVRVAAATADPNITGITTVPSPVEATAASVQFTLTGTNFNPAMVRVTIVDPTGGTIVLGTIFLTNLSTTAVSGTFSPVTPGSYSFSVRNGTTGTSSSSYPVAVSAVPITNSFDPPSPRALVPFAFILGGSGFDPGRVEVVITGPAGPSSTTTTIANNSLTSTTTSLTGQFPASAVGSYAISVRNGPTGTLSNSQPVTVVVAPACVAPTLIHDEFESPLAWSDVVYSATGGATEPGPTLASTGGTNNTGYLRMAHILPSVSSLGVNHMLTAMPYNPAIQGAIDHIDYHEDEIEFNPPFAGAAIGSSFIIQQGGLSYTRPLGTNGAFTNLIWTTVSLPGLTAASFPGIDFSASGGVLTFGFRRSNTSNGGPAITMTHGIDNFSVTICH